MQTLRRLLGKIAPGIVLAASLSGCGTASPPAGATLFSRLGGADGVAAIVDRMLAIVLADPRINQTFEGTPLKRLRTSLNEQFCTVTDGPCVYRGDPMKEVHQGLAITDAGFNALAEDLQSAMEQLDVPSRERNRLMARLAPMHRDIVSR